MLGTENRTFFDMVTCYLMGIFTLGSALTLLFALSYLELAFAL
jgi:hypothetical protein